MSRTNSLVWLTGAAMGIAGTASAQSLDESRAYSAELLADAQERASLLQAGASGHDENGFYVGSADGNNRLGVSGYSQFRYQITQSDLPGTADGDANDFSVNDIRIAFHGHVGNPDTFFKFEGAFADPAFGAGQAFGLTYGYVGQRYDGGWSVKAGQFKLPLMKEELIADNKQQTMDRSSVNSAFTQGFSQGVQVNYAPEGEQWRAMAAFSDGLNTAAAPEGSAPPASFLGGTSNSDVALTGRFEYAISGDWDQFDTYSSGFNGAEGLLIGGAAHVQFGDSAIGGASTDVFQVTADATWQTSQNFNIFGAVVLRTIDTTVGGTSVDGTDIGFVIQGGYWLNETTELFGRFDVSLADTVSEDFTGITAGANWFPSADNRNIKVTGEILIFPDGMSSATGVSLTPPSFANGTPFGAATDTTLTGRGQVQLDF